MARCGLNHNRKKFLKECFEEDNLYLDCPYCESTFFYTEVELDHIESVFAGGSNNKDNLLPICKECNRSKHHKVLHAWLITKSISPEAVYNRLKKLNKKVPSAMLAYLGFDE
jgi:5-methylcytosine-specific restriction endonuclease McrA